MKIVSSLKTAAGFFVLVVCCSSAFFATAVPDWQEVADTEAARLIGGQITCGNDYNECGTTTFCANPPADCKPTYGVGACGNDPAKVGGGVYCANEEPLTQCGIVYSTTSCSE